MRLQLHFPAKPYKLNQPWGVYNPEVYSRFGFTSHNGVDIALGYDKTVRAPFEGTVIRIGNQPNGGGIFVGLLSEEYEFADTNARVLADFLHMQSLSVTEGQKVKVGDVLGIADNTGFSTGPHTHIQFRRVNWDGTTATTIDKNDANNSFDPTPFWNGMYAQDVNVDSLLTYYVSLLTHYRDLLKQAVSKKPSRITQLAEAMKQFEGYFAPGENPRHPKGTPSYLNNNPGNIKFANQPGTTGKDSQGHAVFKTYQDGYNALIRQLTLVATGTSPVYNEYANKLGLKDSSHLSLKQFFAKYAEANQEKYAQFVADRLQVTPDIKIKTLL